MRDAIIKGLAKLDCTRSGHATAIPALRKATGLSKAEFDRTVFEMACEGELDLMRYDWTQGLDDAQRAELIPDGAGEFFIGVALA